MRPSRTRRPAHIAVAVVLAGLVATQGASRTWASGQSNSGSSSGDSSSKDSNSSNGSNDSSHSSAESSHSSRDSSKDSDNSTQNSPKNSSDWTTKSSSDWTTHSHGAHVFSIVFAVVAVGATVVGYLAANATNSARQDHAATALAEFMRRQHALLTHDVTMAEGPVLAAWVHDLRLRPDEAERLRRALEGSREQGALLAALNGPIDGAQARQFAAAFMRATTRALGAARTKALVGQVVQAVGMG
ncbi:MAG TPA: hypothetical protein VHK47_24035 [Polyangia bacterium]|nr:hypothetical protein [Polyangia bacterium]